jgi:hypothetical protein
MHLHEAQQRSIGKLQPLSSAMHSCVGVVNHSTESSISELVLM